MKSRKKTSLKKRSSKKTVASRTAKPVQSKSKKKSTTATKKSKPRSSSSVILSAQKTPSSVITPMIRALLDSAASGILVIDHQRRIVAVNAKFCDLFNADEPTLTSWKESDLVMRFTSLVREAERFTKERDLIDNENYIVSDEIEFTHMSGRFFLRQILPIPDERGKIVGRLWKFRDVTYERHIAVVYRDIEKKKFEFEEKNQELENAYRRLEEMRRDVVEANQLKSQFLSNMSHELRTPLNSIMALSSILLARMDGELTEEQEKQIRIIEKSGKNLLALINDILDLSKIESGKMDVFFAEYAVREFADSIRMTVLPMVRESNLEMEVDVDETLDIHSTDENKLKQILLNLLSNAIKFTPHGKVRLQVRPTKFADVLEFSVIDTGIGIDRENYEKIFDPFRQLDGSATRKYGGTGLGLAVTKRMVELLGGKISVESEIGKGSTFKFILPAKKRGDSSKPFSAQEIEAMFTRKQDEADQLITDSAIDSAKKTVLLVDDDKETLYAFRKYFEEEHYNILFAQDGETALVKSAQYRPNVITLDIMMPRKDGWEVLQELKKNPDTKNIPVAIVSMIDNKKLGYSLGTSDYLVKPVQRDAFMKRIQKLTEMKGLRKILIVDDDLSQAELIEEILESDDFLSEVATSGEKAIQAARRKSYDLVILDLMMPQIDGFAVLSSLQSDPITQNLPVLVLTGKLLTQEDHRKLSGNHYYIFQKSAFSREKLLEQIHRIMEAERNAAKP
ncbi:response regulator [bacterium]|nr:response regulator [bacterium]NUN46300.1 response regulator [bacterium]